MNCQGAMSSQDSSERLSVLLDGQLEPSERGRLEAHLAVCSLCQQELSDLQGVDALLKEYLLRTDAPLDFKEKGFRQFQRATDAMLLENSRAWARQRWVLGPWPGSPSY